MFTNEQTSKQKNDKRECTFMRLNARQEQILTILKEEKRVFVNELADKLCFSEMTIRRDLCALEAAGYLRRFKGGAISSDKENLPIEARINLMTKQKAELSQLARKYLEDDICVFIDCSSTCSFVIPILGEFKRVKIITNSVQNLLLAAKYHIECVLVGGEYYEKDMCTVGGYAEDFLRSINADVGFFSAMGISNDGTVTDNNERQTSLKKVAMRSCDKKIIMMDKSKLGRKFLYTMSEKKDITEILII